MQTFLTLVTPPHSFSRGSALSGKPSKLRAISQASRWLSASALIAASSIMPLAHAAKVQADDLKRMSADAQQRKLTPVIVHLANTSWEDLAKNQAGIKTRMQAKLELLLAELGQNVSTAGRDDNGLGQVRLLVTEAGLQILASSGNAVSFWPGESWASNSPLSDVEGRLSAIEAQLSKQGYVDLTVMPNVDGLEFELDKRSPGSFRAWARSQEARQQALQRAQDLMERMDAKHLLDKNTAMNNLRSMAAQQGATTLPLAASAARQAPPASAALEYTVRVNREGLEQLAASPHIRSLSLANHVDQRPMRITDEVMQAAQKNGSVSVMIALRTPLFGGAQTKASFEAQTQAHRRSLQELLQEAGVRQPMQDMAAIGSFSGDLTLAQLQALKRNADGRLLEVSLNFAGIQDHRATSLATMQISRAHNLGLKGAGQNIVVIESGGVLGTHNEFLKSDGTSRVIYRGCYGTNGENNEATDAPRRFATACLNSNANGDSPTDNALNYATLIGSGHASHVAAIAAGNNGVAPEANIYSIRISSKNMLLVNGIYEERGITIASADVAAALGYVAGIIIRYPTIIPVAAPNNPFTVNMSIGLLGQHSATCANLSPAVNAAADMLRRNGVPVIASTGNNFRRNAINFPACVGGVIKVGATRNNLNDTTVANFTNLAKPSNFSLSDPIAQSVDPGTFWLAPGGGSRNSSGSFETTVNSAHEISTSAMQTFGGTSQAAPHVAGVYALLKQQIPNAHVWGLTRWLVANASSPIPVCIGIADTTVNTNNCTVPGAQLINFNGLRLNF